MEICSRWATGSSFYITKTAKMMLVFRKNSVFCDFLISYVCSRNHTFPLPKAFQKAFSKSHFILFFYNIKYAVISFIKPGQTDARLCCHCPSYLIISNSSSRLYTFFVDNMIKSCITMCVILYHCSNKSPYSYAIYLLIDCWQFNPEMLHNHMAMYFYFIFCEGQTSWTKPKLH